MSLPRRTRPPRSNGERRRRDPRAECNNAPAEDAILKEETAPETARTRRDPRAERGPRAPAGENPRLDRARPLRPVEETSAPERTASVEAPQTIVIDNPACWVVAVPDLAGGRLSAHDRSILGAARQLADAGGGAVVVLAFTAAGDLGPAGADRVMQFDTGGSSDYAPELHAAAIRRAVDDLGARHVLFPESAGGGADLGRRVAAGLGEMPATRIQALAPDRVLGRGDGDRVEFEREPPRIMLIADEAVDPVIGKQYEARSIEPPAVEDVVVRITDAGELPVDPGSVPLTEADFIVSAGNGVQDWPAFHNLAKALGASIGGSRPVCDAGSLARDRQIGASGTLVSARCYLALGISGAPQHLQGITECEHVIAVNNDPHAEMLKRADLGIVADVQALMPALITLTTEGRKQNV